MSYDAVRVLVSEMCRSLELMKEKRMMLHSYLVSKPVIS